MKNANSYSVRTSVPSVYKSLQRNLSGLSKRVEFYFSNIFAFILDWYVRNYMKWKPHQTWKTFVLIWRTNHSFYESGTKTNAFYKMLFILHAYFYRSWWAGPESNLWVAEGFYLQFISFSTWVKITFPFNIYIIISISIF
jgi:hypothetical protein